MLFTHFFFSPGLLDFIFRFQFGTLTEKIVCLARFFFVHPLRSSPNSIFDNNNTEKALRKYLHRFLAKSGDMENMTVEILPVVFFLCSWLAH